MAAWGSTLIVDEAGQCTTISSVDQAVRRYRVDRVLRQHAMVDAYERWRQFEHSEFAPFVPQLTWPHSAWTESAVKAALGMMRDGVAPGIPNMPLAVWNTAEHMAGRRCPPL